MKLILASNSKFRKTIFDIIGWKYEILTSKVEEKSDSTDPHQYVMDLSKDKANSVSSQINEKAIIIAADTVICMGNKIFEKPKNKQEAFDNMKYMSGKSNFALTGVTIKDLYQNKELSFVDSTEVYFRNISDDDISWYVQNESDILDKAGYGIGGKASLFVDKIVGDFYNVLGLPIGKLYSKINELGYKISDFEMQKTN